MLSTTQYATIAVWNPKMKSSVISLWNVIGCVIGWNSFHVRWNVASQARRVTAQPMLSNTCSASRRGKFCRSSGQRRPAQTISGVRHAEM